MRRRRRRRRKEDRAAQKTNFWIHGLAALGDERWEEAVRTIQRFLKTTTVDQERLMAYLNLGSCYLELERYDKTLEMLDHAEQAVPDYPDIIRNRAVTHALAGRIQEAIAAFETFEQRLPQHVRQTQTQGLLEKLHRIEKGDLLPGDYVVDYYVEQVDHNIELGDYHLVEHKSHRMIEANPARPEGHFYLGISRQHQERYDEALEALMTAYELDPEAIPTRDSIGFIYLKMGKPEQAIHWLKLVLADEPQHLSAMYNLGKAHQQLDQQDEAVAWWRRLLEIAPDHYAAQERLHELGEGPEPVEPPLPPEAHQMKRLTPRIKQMMRDPKVYLNGDVTITQDSTGFILEDAENPRNFTLYSGAPYSVGNVPVKDKQHMLDAIGMIKMLLRMINGSNTRHVKVLIYYQDQEVFSYNLQFANGDVADFGTEGQFIITEIPQLFKLNIDSDLATPYGNPMQGMMIYLDQGIEPGLYISTLGEPGKLSSY